MPTLQNRPAHASNNIGVMLPSSDALKPLSTASQSQVVQRNHCDKQNSQTTVKAAAWNNASAASSVVNVDSCQCVCEPTPVPSPLSPTDRGLDLQHHNWSKQLESCASHGLKGEGYRVDKPRRDKRPHIADVLVLTQILAVPLNALV